MEDQEKKFLRYFKFTEAVAWTFLNTFEKINIFSKKDSLNYYKPISFCIKKICVHQVKLDRMVTMNFFLNMFI